MNTNISKKYKTILITGGAGFIGGNLINELLLNSDSKIINVDKLGYASDLIKLEVTKKELGLYFEKRYKFVNLDLKKPSGLDPILNQYQPDLIFNLAAESHVDKSIINPFHFIESNILGTFNLLESVKSYLKIFPEKNKTFKLVHISTDEVFGSLGKNGFFNEHSKYKPNSPYSASKASSDHLVNAWQKTYDIPAIITNCSNNYGPWQFPEKLIPLTIIKASKLEPIRIYGNGENVREWIYVFDHIEGLISVANNGENGKTYCIGSKNTITNNYLVKNICEILDVLEPKNMPHQELIEYVPDRLGHDYRYAIDSSFIKKSIGWESKFNFNETLKLTVQWYLDHQDWSLDLMTRHNLSIGDNKYKL